MNLPKIDNYSFKNKIIYNFILDLFRFIQINQLEYKCYVSKLNLLFSNQSIGIHSLEELLNIIKYKYNIYIQSLDSTSSYYKLTNSLLSESNIRNYLCDIHSSLLFHKTKMDVISNMNPNWKAGELNKLVSDFYTLGKDGNYYNILEIVDEDRIYIAKSIHNYFSLIDFDGEIVYGKDKKINTFIYINNGYYLLSNGSLFKIINKDGIEFYSYDNNYQFAGTIKDPYGNIFRKIGQKVDEGLFSNLTNYKLVHELGILKYNIELDDIFSIESKNVDNTCIYGIKDKKDGCFD